MSGKSTINEILESVAGEMVDNGIYWAEVQAEFEKLFIIKALQNSGGNVYRAAELMGVHRNTLSKKIREYEIERRLYRHPKSQNRGS